MSNREFPDDYTRWEQIRNSLTPEELAFVARQRQEQFKQDPTDDPIYNANDLLHKVLPPTRWAIEDILPEGLTILAGKPKKGKSWMALGMSIAIATGGLAFGSIPVEAGDVLYLALEDSPRRMQSRLHTVLGLDSGASIPNISRLSITHKCPRIGEGAEDYISSWLREHPSTRLVIVDVLKKIRPARRRNGNGYDDDYSDAEPLQRLASEYGVAILVLTHMRKADASDPLDTLNATLGLSGAADNVLALMRERGQADAVLAGAGRDIIDIDLALRWDAFTASWSILGNADEYTLSQERKEVLDIIRTLGKPIWPKDLYPLLPHKKPTAIRALLSRMAKNGEVDLGQEGYAAKTS